MMNVILCVGRSKGNSVLLSDVAQLATILECSNELSALSATSGCRTATSCCTEDLLRHSTNPLKCFDKQGETTALLYT